MTYSKLEAIAIYVVKQAFGMIYEHQCTTGSFLTIEFSPLWFTIVIFGMFAKPPLASN